MKKKKRIVSQKTRDKISRANKGRIKDFFELKNLRRICGKSVSQYDKSGNFIKTFECVADGAKMLNISSSNICACCKGKCKTAGGYIWKYANEGENNAELIEENNLKIN